MVYEGGLKKSKKLSTWFMNDPLKDFTLKEFLKCTFSMIFNFCRKFSGCTYYMGL